jgi:hypothetical protein
MVYIYVETTPRKTWQNRTGESTETGAKRYTDGASVVHII